MSGRKFGIRLFDGFSRLLSARSGRSVSLTLLRSYVLRRSSMLRLETVACSLVEFPHATPHLGFRRDSSVISHFGFRHQMGRLGREHGFGNGLGIS